jgi:hypothetical protein
MTPGKAKQGEDSQKTVILLFSAEGCPACHAQQKILDVLKGKHPTWEIQVLKLDGADEGADERILKRELMAIPVLAISRNGDIVIEAEGLQPAREVEKLFKQAEQLTAKINVLVRKGTKK